MVSDFFKIIFVASKKPEDEKEFREKLDQVMSLGVDEVCECIIIYMYMHKAVTFAVTVH